MPEFTSSQLDAIDYRGLDACVVAGPGSGKTTVLVERYRALIEEHGFEPRQILAITFTEKAAANMKARLAELFAHDPLRLRDLESAYVSTIHGFCARVLRENAIAAGIDPRFKVLDSREGEELQYSCISGALDELVEMQRSEALELIGAVQTPFNLAADLRSVWDGIRSAGKGIADVRAMPCPTPQVDPHEMSNVLRGLLANWTGRNTAKQQQERAELFEFAERLEHSGNVFALIAEWKLTLSRVPDDRREELKKFRETVKAWAVDCHTARFRAMIFDALTRFEELYSERKVAAGVLDFNDLERLAVELLRGNPEVGRRIRTQFRQVMLDEFQDINEQQAELIALVRADDVFFAVGDVNQSIYGFRHARPEIFNAYRSEIAAASKHSAELSCNFRSRNEILRCVETLLNEAEGIDPRELLAGSAFPRKAQPSIEVLKVLDKDTDELAAKEARWIAHRILSLRGALELGPNGNTRAADFRDFAVLCRNSESMKPILEAFNQLNIPYICGRRQSFLLSREGLDITALLHTIANPLNGIALATVLRSGLAGISDEALLRLRVLGGSVSGGLNRLASDNATFGEFAPEDSRKLRRFIGNLKRWRTAQTVSPLEALIVRALSDCGVQWIPGTPLAANIESFLHLARTRGEELGLAGLLQDIETLQQAVSLESDLSDRDQGNCVQVMTAHSAKGLEFPIAIIAAMDKGTKRNAAPATFTPAFGLGLKWSPGLSDSWQLRNEKQLEEREKHEAHRLLYVAMTRAEEHLILSYSRGRNKPSNWAKLVEKFFGLNSCDPSCGASDVPRLQTVTAPNGDTFEAAIRVVESEPPPTYAPAPGLPDGEAILTIPAPPIADRHDSAVNVTALTVFADCPRKYYLQRYIGWNGRRLSHFDPEDLPSEDLPSDEEESADELNAAGLGSAVHEILAGKVGAYPDEARRLADIFFESDLGKRAASAARSGREWDFIVDIEGMLVRGTVDLWFEAAGDITVVDYKTDKHPNPAAYAPQLSLYGLAIERAFGKRPAQAWLHFLRSDTKFEMAMDDAAIRRVKNLLGELAQAQDTLRFDLREGEHCRACQFYRGMCPAGL